MKRPNVGLFNRTLLGVEDFHYSWLDLTTGETGTYRVRMNRIEFLEWLARWNLRAEYKCWEVKA